MADWPTVPDASGNALPGNAVNMEQADIALDTPGGTFSRKSFVFDGVDERLNMGDVLDWDRGGPQSWEFWIKTTSSAISVIIHKQGSVGWNLSLNSTGTLVFSVIQVFATGDTVVESSVVVDTGAWVHVVITWSGATGLGADCKMYFNATEDASLTIVRDLVTGSILNSDDFMIAGYAGDVQPLAGSMTEPAVYSDVLSAGEVVWLYNTLSPPDKLDGSAPDNLRAWWRADGVSWPVQGLSASNFSPSAQDKDSHGQVLVSSGGGGPGIILSFKMRALKDPGPGYEVWVVTGSPDWTGASAPGPIQVPSIVIADQWET